MIDLDELERRAKAATQVDARRFVHLSKPNAAFHLACSPETILALVRIARAAQTAADSLAAIVEVARLRIESGLDPREQFQRAYDEILGVIETLALEEP